MNYSLKQIILLSTILFFTSCDKDVEIPQRQLTPTKVFKNACFQVTNSLLDTKTFLSLVDCINKNNRFSYISSWLKSLTSEDLTFFIENFNSIILEISKLKPLSQKEIDTIAKNQIAPYLKNIATLIETENIELILSFLSQILGAKQIEDLSLVITTLLKDEIFLSNLTKELSELSNFKKNMLSTLEDSYINNENLYKYATPIPANIFLLTKEYKISRTLIPLVKNLISPINFISYLDSLEIYKDSLITQNFNDLKKNSVLVYSYIAPNIITHLEELKKISPTAKNNASINDLQSYFKNLTSSGDWMEIEKKIKKEKLSILAEKISIVKNIFKTYLPAYKLNEFATTPLSLTLNSLTSNDINNFLYGLNLLFTMQMNNSQLLFENLAILTQASDMPIYPTKLGASPIFESLTGLHLYVNNMSELALATIAYSDENNQDSSLKKNLQNFYKYFNFLKSNSYCYLLVENCNDRFKSNRDIILNNFYCTPQTCDSYLDDKNNFAFLYLKSFLKSMAQANSLSIFQNLFATDSLTHLKNIILLELENKNILSLFNYFTLNSSLTTFPPNTHQERILTLTKKTISLLSKEVKFNSSEKPVLISEFIEDILFSITNTLEKRTLLQELFVDKNGFEMIASLNPSNLFKRPNIKTKSIFHTSEPLKLERTISIMQNLLATLKNENELKSFKESLDTGTLKDLLVDTLKFINLLSKYSTQKKSIRISQTN